MNIRTTDFLGLLLLECPSFTDSRGFFRETFRADWPLPSFVQDNQSFSEKGVIRGLHFQAEPHAQGKLVQVISGHIQDIVVDLRPDSPTFKQYFEILLDGKELLYVPPGFAHGFLALKDTYLNYKCTNYYNPTFESGIAWNDSTLKLPWRIKNHDIWFERMSQRDRNWPTLTSYLARKNLS